MWAFDDFGFLISGSPCNVWPLCTCDLIHSLEKRKVDRVAHALEKVTKHLSLTVSNLQSAGHIVVKYAELYHILHAHGACQKLEE